MMKMEECEDKQDFGWDKILRPVPISTIKMDYWIAFAMKTA